MFYGFVILYYTKYAYLLGARNFLPLPFKHFGRLSYFRSSRVTLNEPKTFAFVFRYVRVSLLSTGLLLDTQVIRIQLEILGPVKTTCKGVRGSNPGSLGHCSLNRSVGALSCQWYLIQLLVQYCTYIFFVIRILQ